MSLRLRPAARAAVAALLISVLGACAGARTARDAPLPADTASDTAAPVPVGSALAEAVDEEGADSAGEAGSGAGDGGEAQPLSPEQLDPWQPFNRRMHTFNRAVDRAFLRPVARGYVKVVPSVMRLGVSNFFNNLFQPITAINYLLQGEPKTAGSAAGRFLLNATLGLGGVLDPATHAGIPFHDNDFGHTLATWGWERSRYLVLPMFGPATVRDAFSKIASTGASPVGYLAAQHGPAISLLYGIDARAGGLATEAFLQNVEDEYLMVRDAYLQRRHCQLEDCSDELPEYLLPDYEVELPDFEWRR